MMTTKNGVSPAQGAGTPQIDKNKIKEWMKRDLGFAINLLNAIYSDPDMCDALAEFMIGRFENAKAKEELAKQKSES